MELSMTSLRVWRLTDWLEHKCAGHTPKTTIFGDQKVKADPMSCSEGNCLV